MYRVELKDFPILKLQNWEPSVPNVPRGVESWLNGFMIWNRQTVPNVPRGVESADPDVGSNSFPMKCS